jgi:SAM-dependent methyltransferase
MKVSSPPAAADRPFAFGKNWASYAKLVSESRIDSAVANLRRLAGGTLEGRRFLDIGCGSGLHALAALRLGAAEVLAVDIDRDSVDTTRRVLEGNTPGLPWRALQMSVFDLDPDILGRFDVVYSWGVLHHTGNLDGALRKAAAMVSERGQFAFALYRRTRLCWLWKIEKRWYAGAGPRAQAAARSAYVLLRRALLLRDGSSFASYVRDYAGMRGMDFYHDVHDWLGGWPYESVSAAEVDELMRGLGMRHVRSFTLPVVSLGLTGSGCDEFVYEASSSHD